MPRLYFVDAWFLIARGNRFDSHHEAALHLGRALRPSSFITHDGVFMEVLAYFAGYGGLFRTEVAALIRESAVAFKEVVPADRALFSAGLALYERRPDKAYSVVDCMSMALMKQRNIAHVLTNDHHFRQEGFTVLSDAP